MTHTDAITLIEGAIDADTPARTWADLGAGTGIFTRALAARLPSGSVVHAVDIDRRALAQVGDGVAAVRIETHRLDFTHDQWPFADLDGILIANALHYAADRSALLTRCADHLGPGRTLVLVEYDIERANRWVPYPVSRMTAAQLLTASGFRDVRVIGERPSRYHGRMYAICGQRS